MRPYQKIALAVGLLWVIVVFPAYLYDLNPDCGDCFKGWTPTLFFSFCMPLCLWWATGTLKHIVAWFKGSSV